MKKMKWIKIAGKKPPANIPVLIAYGYIFDNEDENIIGYEVTCKYLSY